jgi:hypothetical protein
MSIPLHRNRNRNRNRNRIRNRYPTVLIPFLYAGLRLLTAGICPVPAAVMIDPLPILLAKRDYDVSGLLFLPGLIAGDLMAGMGVGPMLGRAFLICLFWLSPVEGGFHRKAWIWTFQYALITGIAVDMRGVYPLGFVTAAGILQGFLWWGLLTPKTGGGTLMPLGPLLFPPVALLLVHLVLPSPALWPLPAMRDTSSGWVVGFSLLVLLEPGFWWVGRRWTEWDVIGRLSLLMKRRNRLEP